jgi:hypothetical protein
VGLTRNDAYAHRFDRIRIHGLNIGWTETEGEDATQRAFHGAGDDWVSAAAAQLPMGKLGQISEIADFVIFVLSDRSGVVTGSVIDWDQNVLGATTEAVVRSSCTRLDRCSLAQSDVVRERFVRLCRTPSSRSIAARTAH